MIPLEDWMEVELFQPQAARLDIKLALPDSVDPTKDESAAFTVLKVGPGIGEEPVKVKPGDTCVMYGFGSIAKLKLPNGKSTLVGQARNVCFILEKTDMEKGGDDAGIRLATS